MTITIHPIYRRRRQYYTHTHNILFEMLNTFMVHPLHCTPIYCVVYCFSDSFYMGIYLSICSLFILSYNEEISHNTTLQYNEEKSGFREL